MNFPAALIRSLAYLSLACATLVCATLAGAAPARAAAPSPAFRYEGRAIAYRVWRLVSLEGYTHVHAVGLGPGGASIAGDALAKGVRRCLLWSAGTITDISPAGWDSCQLSGMSSNGTLAGRVDAGGKSEGFIYRAGRGYVIPSAVSFSAINASGLALGVREDGTPGVFDGMRGTWPVFEDLGRGCAITDPLALNDRFVFGATTCANGLSRYALADAGHFLPLMLPPNLHASSILTASDQLVLYDPLPGGHAYLWQIGSARPPLDLGDAPDYEYGNYSPVAANAAGAVVGENHPQFFAWVHTPLDGTRELDGLIVPGTFFGLSVADIDESGEILVQAFDFDTMGGPVWLVLRPAAR